MKSEVELNVFFNTKLKRLLEPLEQYRYEHVQKIKNNLYGAAVFGLFLLIGIVSQIHLLIFILCFPMFICLGYAYQNFANMSAYLTKHFKNKILPELMNFMFDEYEYIANQKIAKSVLEKSMIFPNYIAGVRGEDFMRFKIGESIIMFCEANVISNNEQVIFKGIFISATFNKNFLAKTFVLPRKTKNLFWNIHKQLFGIFSRIKLEDIEFSKEFIVLGTDQVEARYILTPSLMQRILDYKKKTKKGISFSFVENRLYCAIPKFRNLFEPALFEPFDLEFIKRNYTPLKLYTDLVDDLNLNLRIWTKQ